VGSAHGRPQTPQSEHEDAKFCLFPRELHMRGRRTTLRIADLKSAAYRMPYLRLELYWHGVELFDFRGGFLSALGPSLFHQL